MAPETPTVAPPTLTRLLARATALQDTVLLAPLAPLEALSVRLLPGAGTAWTSALGADAPAALPRPGQWVGDGVRMLWQSPTELLLLAPRPEAMASLAAALRPGMHPLACAVDRSAGLCAIELRGTGIDPLLERLMDAASIPRAPGQGTRGRCHDIAATLVRIDLQRLWIVVDRPCAPHLAEWLVCACGRLGAR